MIKINDELIIRGLLSNYNVIIIKVNTHVSLVIACVCCGWTHTWQSASSVLPSPTLSPLLLAPSTIQTRHLSLNGGRLAKLQMEFGPFNLCLKIHIDGSVPL